MKGSRELIFSRLSARVFLSVTTRHFFPDYCGKRDQLLCARDAKRFCDCFCGWSVGVIHDLDHVWAPVLMFTIDDPPPLTCFLR